jgi:branched-subunit amino acid transport protein
MRSETLYLILGMAAVTYLTRIASLVLMTRLPIPSGVSAGLRFIPVGILTAIVVPGVFAPEGQISLSLANRFLIAGFVSALVAAKWKNVFLAMGAGMVVAAILQGIS